MIEVKIPGHGHLQLKALVLDYNGTLAVDGQLLPGVAERLRSLAEQLTVHVITADTFGLAQAQLSGLPLELTILPPENQAEAKRDYILGLGTDSVVAIGNGRNDACMLATAALGIAVLQKEGASAVTLQQADLLSPSILDALDLLTHPKRLIATLRS